MRTGPSHGSLALRVPSMWHHHHHTARRVACQRLHRAAAGVQTMVASGQQRLTVVLDMDECLIHSTDFSDDASGYRQSEARPDDVKRAVETFVLEMGDGVTCTVHKRPGLLEFLSAWCEALSAVWISPPGRPCGT